LLFNRYGIYVTPEPGIFADLGAAWLGWDVDEGHGVAHPPEIEQVLLEPTQTPRKYGFHGTIKPPFHLAEGASYDALLAESLALCAKCAPVEIKDLRIQKLGAFLAIVPVGDVAGLAQLAALILQNLDHFRAPPSESELARRRMTKLSPLQETNLKNWGYPYVLDAFKFHMTLSGSVGESELETLRLIAEKHFAQSLKRPMKVSSLTLVGEAGDGRFHALHRLPLLGK
jgi:hypothetical protein